MKLIEINKEEFFNFVKDRETNNFYQTRQWAEIKRHMGWHTYFVGLDHDGMIMAASMILSRDIALLNKRVFYAPRGFIIDYNDKELVKTFTEEVKKFVKDKKGLFIKIDPYLPVEQLDNNEKCIDILNGLGYKKKIKNNLKPDTLYEINIDKDNLLDSFDEKTRNTILTNEKKSIYVRDIKDDEIDKVISIINNSTTRIDFIGNSLKEIYQILKPDDMINIKLVYMDIDEYVKNASTEEEKKEANEFKYKYSHYIVIGCDVNICYNDTVTAMSTAINDNFKDILANYTLHYETMKWAKEKGYKKYNLNGIYFSEKNKIYNYYKGYNGYVINLIGEFDLVLNPFLYKLYNLFVKDITDFIPKNKPNK